MVLVDTSVWIRFLADRAPHAAMLANLLDQDEAAAHELIQGELLMGDSGGRTELLESYSFLRRVPAVPHREVVEFVRSRRLHGRGIGWIDACLLASALANAVRLWTADERLAKLAAEVGVAYDHG